MMMRTGWLREITGITGEKSTMTAKETTWSLATTHEELNSCKRPPFVWRAFYSLQSYSFRASCWYQHGQESNVSFNARNQATKHAGGASPRRKSPGNRNKNKTSFPLLQSQRHSQNHQLSQSQQDACQQLLTGLQNLPYKRRSQQQL